MSIQLRPNVSVLIECNGRTFRVIDNVRVLLAGQTDRNTSEQIVGRKILDLARTLDAGRQPEEGEGG